MFMEEVDQYINEHLVTNEKSSRRLRIGLNVRLKFGLSLRFRNYKVQTCGESAEGMNSLIVFSISEVISLSLVGYSFFMYALLTSSAAHY